jgi:hypothetical protein
MLLLLASLISHLCACFYSCCLCTDHDELRSLDVCGCRALGGLMASSPELQRVLARACHSLTRVVLDSRQLIFLDVSNCGALAGLTLEALAPAVQALQVSEQMQGGGDWVWCACVNW